MTDTIGEAISDVEFQVLSNAGDLVLVRQNLGQLDQNEILGGKILKLFFSTIVVQL